MKCHGHGISILTHTSAPLSPVTEHAAMKAENTSSVHHLYIIWLYACPSSEPWIRNPGWRPSLLLTTKPSPHNSTLHKACSLKVRWLFVHKNVLAILLAFYSKSRTVWISVMGSQLLVCLCVCKEFPVLQFFKFEIPFIFIIFINHVASIKLM